MSIKNVWTCTVSEDASLVPSKFEKESLKTPEVRGRVDSIFPYTRNPDFFGRQDFLETLDRHLIPTSTTKVLQTFAICGMGGMGKTQIAIEFALSRRDKFDGVFWIQADTPIEIDESFARISERLGLADSSDTLDGVVSRNYILAWLSTYRKKNKNTLNGEPILNSEPFKWLLVFDNAEIISILRDYWPVGACGSILITSRDPLAKSELNDGAGLDLQPFTAEDSSFLLQKLTEENKSEESKANALSLGNDFCGLPLAVVQVAALIRKY